MTIIEWSDKAEGDARAYADNFSYGRATGFCVALRMDEHG